LRGDGVAEDASQCGHDGEPSLVFQARDQAVERKGIYQRGMGAVEGGRVLEAGAADFAAGGGEGALRALQLTMPGQVGMAGSANRMRA
jgi:hypothetical protein